MNKQLKWCQNSFTLYHLLVLYTTTALQSRLFLKNIKNFLCKQKLVNNRSIPSTQGERKVTICSHKHSFTPYPSCSPYSRMDRMTDRGTNTFAACGLEDLFFQLCSCVSFLLLWREIVFGVTYQSYQLCHCVWLHRSVFWLRWEKGLGVTYFPTIPVVLLCKFFGFGEKQFWLHSF